MIIYVILFSTVYNCLELHLWGGIGLGFGPLIRLAVNVNHSPICLLNIYFMQIHIATVTEPELNHYGWEGAFSKIKLPFCLAKYYNRR